MNQRTLKALNKEIIRWSGILQGKKSEKYTLNGNKSDLCALHFNLRKPSAPCPTCPLEIAGHGCNHEGSLWAKARDEINLGSPENTVSWGEKECWEINGHPEQYCQQYYHMLRDVAAKG